MLQNFLFLYISKQMAFPYYGPPTMIYINNFFTLLYTFKKIRFAIYFQKLNVALPADRPSI
jgi:hypothetical protein